MAKIAAIGEVMVELSPFPNTENSQRELLALSFAGDTYNTSVYTARLGIDTQYITQLGEDTHSAQILHRMTLEGIGTQLIKQLPGRLPGLYMIRNTQNGEREFFYWRNEAPARELFSSQEAAETLYRQLLHVDCVYLSGITLAIIGEQSRQQLYHVLSNLRSQNITIAFDSNYRPRLWPSLTEAQNSMLHMMQYTDIALLTLDDEKLLWGDNSVNDCKQRYAQFPVRELVLKRGSDSAIIISHDQTMEIPVPLVSNVIDTTGAGDSFNAGFLAGRLSGKSLEDSARLGIQCASIIIQHRGAIIDKATFTQELALAQRQ